MTTAKNKIPKFIIDEFNDEDKRDYLLLLGNQVFELTKILYKCSDILQTARDKKDNNLEIKNLNNSNLYFINPSLIKLIEEFENELIFLEQVKTDTMDFTKYVNFISKLIDEYEEILKCNINNLNNSALYKHLKTIYNDMLLKTKVANVFNYYNETFYYDSTDPEGIA